MNDHLDTASQPQAPANKAAGRRRFLGAGAGVAPVVLTLASQPALATTCFTPSRALSANMSVAFERRQSALGQDFRCNGTGSVKSYKDHTTWPAGVVRPVAAIPAKEGIPARHGKPAVPPVAAVAAVPGAKFSDLFPGSTKTGTVADILSKESTSLHAALIAAMFNLRVVPSQISDKVMTPSSLRAILKEFEAKGVWKPYAGGKEWTPGDFVKYLGDNYIIGKET